MSEEPEQVDADQYLITEPSNECILAILGLLIVIGSVVGGLAVSARFGIAVFVGGILAFVNYFMMRRSLRTIFAGVNENERPRFIGAGYFIRYLIVGAVIALLHLFEILPIAGIILGAAGLAFAVIVEAFIRVFAAIFGNKEI